MSTATRIYIATHGEAKRLIRATSQAVARNHIARDSIQVEVASQDDLVRMISGGWVVEETSNAPAQKELGE